MAENEDGQERTESPTARRRQQALDEGNIARSAELSAAAVLLAGAAMLGMSGGGSLGNFATRVMRESAGALSAGPLTPVGAVNVIRTVTLGLLVALAPFIGGVVAVTVFVNLAQARGQMSPGALSPKWQNLNPTGGLRKLFSKDALINLPKSLLKLVALGWITWVVLKSHWPELVSLCMTGPGAVLAVMQTLTVRLVLTIGLAFLVIAGADYAWQVWRHEESLKMTKQEVRNENRETDGDPHVKARIRSMQMQRARSRMFQAVPKADVVVTNPTHVAVALQYDPEISPAPIVVAMGERKVAERIKKIARESGVPCVENKPVARALLATCAIGKPIAPALYAAVAEILAWVFRTRNPHYGRTAERRAAA
ncbi:MAG: flagellar biosynthesis protein FlhB [Burkholderiaceae bacterium]